MEVPAIGGSAWSFGKVFMAVKRVVWLLLILTPRLAALGIVLWLELLGAVQRILCLYSRSTPPGSQPAHLDRSRKERRFAWWNSPAEPGAWLRYWNSSILAVCLHANIPLVALFARWVAMRRPDLAARPVVMRVLMGWRVEELFSVAGRSGVRMPDQCAMEHVHARLAAALGTGWPQAMRLDPVVITSDCVVETFNAVLREDVLAEVQQSRRIPADSLRSLFIARLPGPCKRRRRGDNVQTAPVAEAAEARRAVVRVRRKGVAEAAAADLRLVRWLLAVLSKMGFAGPRSLAHFEDFAAFVTNQLDLRNEAHMLRLCHAARAHQNDARLRFPRLYGEARAEVLIVSFEEGVCMAEVLCRHQVPVPDDDDDLARVVVAGEVVRAFWTAALRHGLVLGDLSAGTLLLRSSGSGNELEVMSLRCGLAHAIDERMQDDIHAFAACLDAGPLEMVGPLILERVHLPAGGALGAVLDPDGFASGVRELLSQGGRCSRAASPLNVPGTPRAPLAGTTLLHSALALAQKHGVCVGSRHLQFAAALVTVHDVCARLDPVAAGQLLREMQAVAANVTSTSLRQH